MFILVYTIWAISLVFADDHVLSSYMGFVGYVWVNTHSYSDYQRIGA